MSIKINQFKCSYLASPFLECSISIDTIGQSSVLPPLQSPGVMAWQGQESGDKIISSVKWVTAVAFWPETFFIKRQRTKEAAD